MRRIVATFLTAAFAPGPGQHGAEAGPARGGAGGAIPRPTRRATFRTPRISSLTHRRRASQSRCRKAGPGPSDPTGQASPTNTAAVDISLTRPAVGIDVLAGEPGRGGEAGKKHCGPDLRNSPCYAAGRPRHANRLHLHTPSRTRHGQADPVECDHLAEQFKEPERHPSFADRALHELGQIDRGIPFLARHDDRSVVHLGLLVPLLAALRVPS